MVDSRKGGIDDVVLCGLGEYLQPELLVRKSCQYLILPTTFVMVMIVHIVELLEYTFETQNPEV